MKHLATICACALLGWLAKRREPREPVVYVDEQQRAAQRERLQEGVRMIVAKHFGFDAPPRVVESQHGVFIRASCEAEAAEIVSQAPQFRARVA